MDNGRINKTTFNWPHSLKVGSKNWCFQIDNQFENTNIEALMPIKDTYYCQQSRKHDMSQ